MNKYAIAQWATTWMQESLSRWMITTCTATGTHAMINSFVCLACNSRRQSNHVQPTPSLHLHTRQPNLIAGRQCSCLWPRIRTQPDSCYVPNVPHCLLCTCARQSNQGTYVWLCHLCLAYCWGLVYTSSPQWQYVCWFVPMLPSSYGTIYQVCNMSSSSMLRSQLCTKAHYSHADIMRCMSSFCTAGSACGKCVESGERTWLPNAANICPPQPLCTCQVEWLSRCTAQNQKQWMRR